MNRKYYDWGYLLADALKRGFWWSIGLMAMFLIVSGQITL